MNSQSTHDVGVRLLVGGLVIFGVGALAFGAFSIRDSIMSPFSNASSIAAVNLGEQLELRSEEDELEALKQLDSDKDGLSDYDEIHIYNTSPYIQDSDSDGQSDFDEISRGTDPNCAPGEDCFGIRLVTPDTKISDLFPQFSDSTTTLKDKTLQEFKNILIEQGYDEERLNSIPEAELLIILEESLKLQEEAVEAGTQFDAVDYDDVRSFLIELGVPEDEVYSLSNSDLDAVLKTFE